MSTNIKVSITDSGIVTPDTGAFTNLDSGHAAMLGGGVLITIFAILGIIVTMRKRSKYHFTADGKRKLGLKTTIGFSIILLAGLGIATGIVSSSNLDLINPTSNTSAIIPAESLTVTAEDINLELSLDKDTPTAYQSVASKVTVSTPNKGGYTLKAYATGTDLTRTDTEDTTNKISVVEGTNKALTDNTWGIATTKPEDESSTVWNTMPTTESEAMTLKTTTSSTESTDTTVYYGAYVTNDLPYGTYEGVSINYVAVSNQIIVENIDDLTYMQDFASLDEDEKADVLDSMTEGEQYRLKDNRDDKSYYISKLKDGNIWMTQNLDFDISSSTTYTNKNTDIGWNSDTSSYDNASWTPVSSTHVAEDTTWVDSDIVPESYDPGDLCWDGVLRGEESRVPLEDATISCRDSGANLHYHLGNYYNWTAAVAMNDSSSYADYGDANQSICPAGWMLPKGGDTEDPKSFKALVTAYGWDDYSLADGYYMWRDPLNYALSSLVEAGVFRAGGIIGVGYSGHYHSSTVSGSGLSTIYVLDEGSDGYVNYDGGPSMYYGFSVRCLVR